MRIFNHFAVVFRPAVFTKHLFTQLIQPGISARIFKRKLHIAFQGLPVVFLLSQIQALAAVTIDVRVSKDQNTPASTVTAPQFATASTNELLLAFVSADAVSSPNTSVSSVSGGGLTWTRVVRTNAQEGTSEIWRAFAASRLSAVSVSAQLSQSVVSSLTVMSFSGVNTAGTNGSGAIGAVGTSNSGQGAPSVGLVPTQSGSMILGVGNDYDQAIARAPFPGQIILHQDLTPTGDTYWVQQLASPSPVAGTSTKLGDSAPSGDRYNLSFCEVLAPSTEQVQSSATSLNFGTVNDGTAVTKALMLTSSGTSSVTLSSASLTGAGFALESSSFPVTLAPGHSLTLQVQFDPASAGAVTGQLSVNTSAASQSVVKVALSGTGAAAAPAPQISLSSSSVAFGNVTAGSSATRAITITSTGTSSLTISSETESGSAFTVAGGPFPLTLAPGKTATLNLAFKPIAIGSDTGKVTLVSNSVQNGTTSVALSGAGVGIQHSVALTWSPPENSSVLVAGYDVYRALGSGSFVLLNSSPTASTSYTDATVQSGSTYTYEITSVGSNGAQSTASNVSTAAIPTP